MYESLELIREPGLFEKYRLAHFAEISSIYYSYIYKLQKILGDQYPESRVAELWASAIREFDMSDFKGDQTLFLLVKDASDRVRIRHQNLSSGSEPDWFIKASIDFCCKYNWNPFKPDNKLPNMRITRNNLLDMYAQYWDVLTYNNNADLVEDYNSEVALLPYYDTNEQSRQLLNNFICDANLILDHFVPDVKPAAPSTPDTDEEEELELAKAIAIALQLKYKYAQKTLVS